MIMYGRQQSLRDVSNRMESYLHTAKQPCLAVNHGRPCCRNWKACAYTRHSPNSTTPSYLCIYPSAPRKGFNLTINFKFKFGIFAYLQRAQFLTDGLGKYRTSVWHDLYQCPDARIYVLATAAADAAAAAVVIVYSNSFLFLNHVPFLSPVYFQTALWPWTVIQFYNTSVLM